MKTLINTSLQGFEIYFNTDKGIETYWLKPGEYLNIPEAFLSPQISLMINRRLLRLQEAV